MFQIGQIFVKNGIEFCLIELVNYDGNLYGFFSVEDKKIDYIFYEMKQTETGCKLVAVVDENLNNILFSMVESSGLNE